MDATDRAENGLGQRRGLILAGPTASGKSALALALAAEMGGSIINADAMQCYRELRLLTARPSEADEAQAPHRLYGVRAAHEPANAAWWREAAKAEMAAADYPILCGGTGMYFSALVKGIADIPDPGETARAEARALLAQIGPEALHAKLDAPTAAKLKPGDSQRIARAYEVLIGTGKGITYWQAQPTDRLQGWDLKMILLDPPRPDLKAAIETRFTAMLAGGALEEARALLALGLPPDAPLLRAHGMPELAAHLRGEISLEEAKTRACLATFQYTKRQMTWFRHQKLVGTTGMQIIHSRIGSHTQFSERNIADLRNFLNSPG
ncbi:tRNA (adenosine(37)-N6)-dimethylallyltransferase MiaA [Acidocella facilis]|uniref:tRNA (adenosine(37)-N6)-dimethylallyltransferase MiaA n=1 Tax=Acidocella facilis TaxID=525 RepID=UPI000479E088|nr:tRNA (adenosine(37)-N6)-dimethylallyltransferase MiaA [Acidocella facilis]